MSPFNEGGITDMQAAAIMMHEMFLSCCNAGFTEDQSIKILIGMMNANSPASFNPPQSPNGQH